MSTNNCGICGCQMDTSPLTQNCGGDCLRCMAICGDGGCAEAAIKYLESQLQAAPAERGVVLPPHDFGGVMIGGVLYARECRDCGFVFIPKEPNNDSENKRAGTCLAQDDSPEDSADGAVGADSVGGSATDFQSVADLNPADHFRGVRKMVEAEAQPVADERGVVLPERLPERMPEGRNIQPGYAQAWNACIDEVARLNPAPATAEQSALDGVVMPDSRLKEDAHEHGQSIRIDAWKQHATLSYWTARLVTDDKTDLLSTASSEREAILSVMDMFVSGSGVGKAKPPATADSDVREVKP